MRNYPINTNGYDMGNVKKWSGFIGDLPAVSMAVVVMVIAVLIVLTLTGSIWA